MKELDMSELLDMSGLPGMDYDTEEIVHPPIVLVDVTSNPVNRQPDLEDDYSRARRMMSYAEQMSLDLAKVVLENAKNSESPRYAEVAVQTINQLMTNAKESLKLHREMKEITAETTSTGTGTAGITVEGDATVFVGTPADLMAQEGTQSEALSKANQDAIEGEATEVKQ